VAALPDENPFTAEVRFRGRMHIPNGTFVQ
jgi:hypothetical protein